MLLVVADPSTFAWIIGQATGSVDRRGDLGTCPLYNF